ncbi:MAG TPA: hypothetical protein VGM56_21150 [Byssovorax sp.]
MRRARSFLPWALAAAAVLAPACGLLGGSESTPPPVDGIDDFGDATPIELCVGGARAVTPSQAAGLAGSLCVDDARPPPACDSDADCDGIERCTCGVCLVDACEGASCGDGRVCAGQRCTTPCSVDLDCEDGERCVTGGCARACTTSDACHAGETCDTLFDACAVTLCGGAIECAPGATCTAEVTVLDQREPDLVTPGPGGLAFVELVSAAGERAIGRAAIGDDTHWSLEPTEPVLASAGAPAALVTGDHVDLWFEAAAGVSHATSDDGGRTFAIGAAPTLTPTEPWERGFVGSPSVVVFLGRTLLFYEGGPRAGIGVAEIGADGVATRLSSAPIATPASVTDPELWRGVTEVRAPHAVVFADALRVYFTGRGVEASDAIIDDAGTPADANDSIGMLATRDVVTWFVAQSDPVYARVTNLRAYLGESEASVVDTPGGAAIVFVTSDATGALTNGLAYAGAP